MGFENYSVSEAHINGPEKLHIDRSKRKIKYHLQGVGFQDSDTLQYVAYIPALEISGYGETKQKAEDMASFSLQQIFDQFLTMSHVELSASLRELGWDESKYFEKYFSKTYLDDEGILKNLNLQGGIKIERFSVAA